MLINPYVFVSASAPTLHSQLVYTGDNSTSRLIPGVDMSGGGWSFIKATAVTQVGSIYFSPNGSSPQRQVNNANTGSAAASATFGSGGITLTANTDNIGSRNYAAYMFKKAASFCDVVTYTGTGSAQTIAHSLGIAPGFIIVKKAGVAQGGLAYHSALGASTAKPVFAAAANVTGSAYWNATSPTSSVFSVGTDIGTNDSGASYFAILMADDSSPSGQVRTFSYTGNNSVSGPTVNLGWEPNFVCILNSSNTNSPVTDAANGFSAGWLNLTTTAGLTGSAGITTSGTGFQVVNTSSSINQSGVTYFGFAIRKP